MSGKFIGDYQGLVADDEVAIPFWNDTQLNALPKSDPEHSPYQEVFAARVPEGAETPVALTRCFGRSLRVGRGQFVFGSHRYALALFTYEKRHRKHQDRNNE